jgi:hypothetical protein
MADLPEATIQVDDEASALASGTDILTVLACVERNDDVLPRVFSSTRALLEQHGYSEGIDYCALHFEETGKPVIFIGLPKAVAGSIGRVDTSGNTGSSAVSVAAGASGILDDAEGHVTVAVGGTVGTDQIQLDLSLDGGETSKRIRIGTATTYTVPYHGHVLTLGAGTLAAGDVVLTYSAKAPRWDSAGITAARTVLAGQQKQSRSWLVIGDLVEEQDASDVLTAINAYATVNDRCSLARVQVRDYAPAGVVSGTPTLTFAEVGATGDTITRSAGSWITDGFIPGMVITVAGTVSNNVTGPISSLTATVLTMGTTDLVAEGPVAGTVTASAELDSSWVADIESEFEGIAAAPRIDIAAGRVYRKSPITQWKAARPAAWAISVREYGPHDVQVPTWRKEDGPLAGWSLENAAGEAVMHDERVDGGLLLAGFSCLRTYANGPSGTFVAMSLTRAVDSSLLSRTHNMHVANIACNVAQAETENAIGMVLELNTNGTGTEASLKLLEERVNTALAINLLQRRSDGPRASDAKWVASRSDILNVPGAELNGVLDLRLNGTIEKIHTRVRVVTAGG